MHDALQWPIRTARSEKAWPAVLLSLLAPVSLAPEPDGLALGQGHRGDSGLGVAHGGSRFTRVIRSVFEAPRG